MSACLLSLAVVSLLLPVSHLPYFPGIMSPLEDVADSFSRLPSMLLSTIPIQQTKWSSKYPEGRVLCVPFSVVASSIKS
jgi:hypothetical protein